MSKSGSIELNNRFLVEWEAELYHPSVFIDLYLHDLKALNVWFNPKILALHFSMNTSMYNRGLVIHNSSGLTVPNALSYFILRANDLHIDSIFDSVLNAIQEE